MLRVLHLTPNEKKIIVEDFVNDLASGDSITARDVKAFSSDGTDVTATRVASIAGATTKIQFEWPISGVNYEDYRVVFKATTTTEILERAIEVRIRTTPVE